MRQRADELRAVCCIQSLPATYGTSARPAPTDSLAAATRADTALSGTLAATTQCCVTPAITATACAVTATNCAVTATTDALTAITGIAAAITAPVAAATRALPATSCAVPAAAWALAATTRSFAAFRIPSALAASGAVTTGFVPVALHRRGLRSPLATTRRGGCHLFQLPWLLPGSWGRLRLL